MLKKIENQYQPDYAVFPGEILQETLASRGTSETEFAERTGLSLKTVSQIINGKAPLTPYSAIKFERVLGVNSILWLNLENNYRLFIAKKNDKKIHKSKVAWVKEFPIKELQRRHVIPPNLSAPETVNALLEFFRVGSIAVWEEKITGLATQYRRSPSFTSSIKAIAAWLRIGINKAQKMEMGEFNKTKFKEALQNIRRLTKENPNVFEPEMISECAKAGVAVIFVKELPGTHLSGAACWIAKNNALIILSLRYKIDDHFWFTFFHEAGHLLLHGKKTINIDSKKLSENTQEKEANNFAEDILIPKKTYHRFIVEHPRITKDAIRRFAKANNISPGIIVGRLQKGNRISFGWFNDLKKKFILKEDYK